jgi:hypothetical protein
MLADGNIKDICKYKDDILLVRKKRVLWETI